MHLSPILLFLAAAATVRPDPRCSARSVGSSVTLVVSYHPTIFKPIPSLTLVNSLQASQYILVFGASVFIKAPLAELAKRAPEALAGLKGACTDFIPSVIPFLLYLHYIMPLTKTGSVVLLTGTGSVTSRTETSPQLETPQVDLDLIVETSKTWIDAGSSWS
ncbi:hypothetical protein OG21DRAFT_1527779 [Imleria badia]|nr:hypothetical protein OG21DRAFT_1527779 [Imleria badia]